MTYKKPSIKQKYLVNLMIVSIRKSVCTQNAIKIHYTVSVVRSYFANHIQK